MDVIAAYREPGTFKAAAAVTGTTHKTVRRIVESAEGRPPEHKARGHNYEDVAGHRPGAPRAHQSDVSPPNACFPRQVPRVMRVRRATSGDWSPTRLRRVNPTIGALHPC
jgi:hypothetical protein